MVARVGENVGPIDEGTAEGTIVGVVEYRTITCRRKIKISMDEAKY